MHAPPPALTDRARALARLDRDLDLLVVGGGVNGLAVAWAAALAGLAVAVVDKGDWGSGTSSWSSRMIHGGLKYLEKLDIRLVRESLRDREWLLRRAPHLVRPLPFTLPSYRGDRHSLPALRLGMMAYGLLSYDKSVPGHRAYSRAGAVARLPGLRTDGLRGAVRYYDAQVEYAERLCVELMLAARAAGAVPLNHTRVVSLHQRAGPAGMVRVTGARLVDELTGESRDVAARVTVNVAGPWVDDLLAGTPLARRRWIGGTKGTHLVVDPFPGAPDEAVYFESVDGRPMMVIPWLGRYLLGSTDLRFSGDPDTVTADDEELDYILAETNRLLPAAGLGRGDVHYAYTGVRPLPYAERGKPGDITRRHEIHDHAPEVEGLLTVVGGKLTTFRALARHALAVLRRSLPLDRRAPALDDQWLPGAGTGAPAPLPEGVAPDLAARLRRLYGGRAAVVAEIMATEPETARVLDPGTGLVAAEVVAAVRHEQASRLSDVLGRRVMVGLEPDLGLGVAEAVLPVLAAELGWDDRRRRQEREAYHAYLRRFRPGKVARDAAAGH